MERHTALETFAELFPVIVKSLRDIALKEDTVQWNRKTIADASGLLSGIEKGSFLVALVIGYNILNYIKGLTVMLQQSSIDITRAMGLVEDTRKSLQDVRHRVKEFHGEWMKRAREMAEEAGTNIPTVPRMCGIQMHRENITAATPDEYYGQTITIPLLDHLLMELTSRFNQHAKKATMGLCLVPSVMRKTHDWRHHVDSLVELFKEDLPSPLSVPSELHTWSIKFTNWDQSTVPSSPLQALIQCDKRYFLTSSRS